MKFTGRTLYVSGTVTTEDIESGVQPINKGLIPIWENERPNYGYLVKFVSSFPAVSATDDQNAPFILTTYSRRDILALRNGGSPAGNQVLQILGISTGISPAGNDRVLATFSPNATIQSNKGIVKRDALVAQSLSIGIDEPRKAVSYYIEMDEYILDDDEYALAMLGESDQNVGNFEVRLS